MQEILEKYQVRKTNKQKSAFIDYLKNRLSKHGYDATIEEKGKWLFKSRNIIVGNPETAKYFVTAHYDTPPISPFPNFMFPTNIPMFIIFQSLLTIFLFAVAWLISIPFAMLPISGEAYVYIYEAIMFGMLLMLMFGPANKHCANDNTSGVITLIKILEKMPEQYRNDICIVFFDNEEKGLFGSQFFAKKHKNIVKNKIVINMDCVGDGQNIVFMSKRKARKDKDLQKFINAMQESVGDKNINFMPKKMKFMMFPSDQANFDKGVGVCSVRKSFLGYYAGRIHTPFDTKCDEVNIEFLSDGIVKSMEVLKDER